MPSPRTIRVLAVLLMFVWAAGGQTVGKDLIFSEIDSMLSDLERITGWKAKRKVRAEWISRERVRTFLEARIQREIKPRDIEIEQTLLRMLGFVPAEFDLKKATVDLVTEQAAAFYDYESKRLYVLDTGEPLLDRRTTLVHELAHALADQHFPLSRYLRDKRVSDDGATARQAVVEGQATWLMWAWQTERLTGRAEVGEQYLAGPGESSDAEFPVLGGVPLYLRESLTFPYSAGLVFQDRVHRKSGKASFSETFQRPPRSTQQILDPETYLTDRVPVELQIPRGTKAVPKRLLGEGTFGELDLRILLTQYCSPKIAEEFGPNWRGGVFRLDELKKDRKPVLSLAIATDNAEQASALLSLYQRVLTGKWKQIQVTEQTATRLKGQGDSGPFETWITGNTLYSIEGGRLK